MQIKEPWALSADDIFAQLNTVESGLTEEEAKIRIGKYGRNAFASKDKTNPLFLFLKQFLSPLIFLLLAAAVLTSIFLHEGPDTAVILFAVLLNVALGFYHEYSAENTLEKLKTYIKDRARVIRDGLEQEIDSELVVPGDIIKLAYGSRVPADTRIVSVNSFRVDEAVLTGESMSVEKIEGIVNVSALVAERKNIAHAGTLIVQGYAIGVVYATGNSTEIGCIAGIVSKTTKTKTPLQKGVGYLAWLIFAAVIVLVSGILVLGLSRGGSFVEMMLLSAAVAVGAVPESLPIALTVILAIGASRIAEKKGVVRKLNAAETLGSTTLSI